MTKRLGDFSSSIHDEAKATKEADVLDPRACGARRFVGKVCIVTGAGQGIARATAKRLAQEGAKVVVEDIYPAAAERTLDELLDFGANAISYVGDVTDSRVCQELMAKTKEAFGRVDVLCNLVGGAHKSGSFETFTTMEIENDVRLSLWSAIWGCHSVLPHMLEQGSGVIVNASAYDVVSFDHVPYAAAKGGVVALTTSLSKEVASRGIRVNCVAPHSTSNDDKLSAYYDVARLSAMSSSERGEYQRRHSERLAQEIPMGRSAHPSEQASTIAFLASEDASFITGQVISCGGGATYR